MPIIDIFPLWRVRSPFAWRFLWITADHMPHLSDKMARDSGIDQQTLARLHHKWPSQSIPPAQHDHLARHIKGR
jgi:hypothetical protein